MALAAAIAEAQDEASHRRDVWTRPRKPPWWKKHDTTSPPTKSFEMLPIGAQSPRTILDNRQDGIARSQRVHLRYSRYAKAVI